MLLRRKQKRQRSELQKTGGREEERLEKAEEARGRKKSGRGELQGKRGMPERIRPIKTLVLEMANTAGNTVTEKSQTAVQHLGRRTQSKTSQV
jgi:hypothetical protein